MILLLLMLKSKNKAKETGFPCVSTFYESEGGREGAYSREVLIQE